MLKNKVITVVMFICLVILPFNVISVHAELLGGKWNVNPVYYPTSSYASLVTSAVSEWNSTLSDISATRRITKGNNAVSATVTDVDSAYGYTGWSATGTPGPNIDSGTYTYGTIRLNNTYMSNYPNSKNKAIIVHEWGHILGLAHTESTTIKSIMAKDGVSKYYGEYKLEAPAAYDETQLNRLY